jgi:hypothetical protein
MKPSPKEICLILGILLILSSGALFMLMSILAEAGAYH